MRKILWLGPPFFAKALRDCGWEDVYIHCSPGYQIYSWDELANIAGFAPDVLVVADASTPPPVLGVENFPCLTVFYSVDSHIHSWHPHYAQAFDTCLVSLGDHVDNFFGPFLGHERICWSPAFAKEEDLPKPEEPKIWDCLFVGTNDRSLMPKRYAFLQELATHVPSLQVKSGNYTQLYPQSRVLVNQAEGGDLNFRVFEAMGCGGCLVTPRVGHGLDKMFVDGEHLVGYAPGDAGDAAYRINFLLQNPDLCEYIGQAGLAEINAKHRAIHRAQTFTDHLCDLAMHGIKELVAMRRTNAHAIRARVLTEPYLLWAREMTLDSQKESFLAAARGKFGPTGIQA